MFKKPALLFILLGIHALCVAQTKPTITVSGHATEAKTNMDLYQVVVVNQRTSEGTLASGGKFSIQAYQTDTILVSASGFAMKKICFKDSAYKSHYSVIIHLDSLQVTLHEVHVYPMRNLNEIHQEEHGLGDIPNTDTYKSVNAMSPITALYERFNRLERSKRKVAEMEDDDKKRQVLKDLFHLYIKYDIIQLDDAQFDTFIDYLNLPDSYITQATDYDLIMAIKYKYEMFEKANSYTRPTMNH
jgi:hypothetical protein